jgi:hypothetical protein
MRKGVEGPAAKWQRPTSRNEHRPGGGGTFQIYVVIPKKCTMGVKEKASEYQNYFHLSQNSPPASQPNYTGNSYANGIFNSNVIC